MFKIALILALFSAFTQAASFDCEKARTSVEKQICSNADISALDDELSKIYKKILSLASKNQISKHEGGAIYNFFRQKQKKWIRERNRNCSKYRGSEQKACLKSYYTSRIAKLKTFAEDTGLVWHNFGHVLFLYTHRPDIAQFFKPYLDKASYEKLSHEILQWEKSYEVCKDRFGAIDDQCTRKIAKKKKAYYDNLLSEYENNRFLQENGGCKKIVRKQISYIEKYENEEAEPEDYLCMIYKIYDRKELQKLVKSPFDFHETTYTVPQNAKTCSVESSRFYNVKEETITHITKNIIVIEAKSYNYTGGLHGDFSSDYLNVDRNSGKTITWEDLFGVGQKVLYEYIVKEVRDRIGFENLERLTDDELYDMAASTYRMQLAPKGVVIRFGLYEISGYGAGEPSFLIPLKKLKKVMTNDKFTYYFSRPLKLYSICKH